MLISFDEAKLVARARHDPTSLTKREKEKALDLDDLNMMSKDEHLFNKETLDILSAK